MKKFYQGSLASFGVKVGIVSARFNEPLTYELLAQTHRELVRLGVAEDDLSIAMVPGALEVPQAVLKMMRNHEVDVVIALGVVVEGETAHFDHVSRESVRALMDITIAVEFPVINGILTVHSVDQALARVSGEANKGVDFARSALEMVSLYKQL